MSLPLLDAEQFSLAPHADALGAACRDVGALYLEVPRLGALQDAVLEQASAFFALPEAEKQALRIESSAHFRGYSRMRGKDDDREQIHFGPEAPGISEDDHSRLLGPNLWPAPLGARFSSTLRAYVTEVAHVAHGLLHAIALALGFSAQRLAQCLSPQPYHLLKLMRYAPRCDSACRDSACRDSARPGMAAHCDFSLLTLLLQRGDGLEVQKPDGAWVRAPARRHTLLVTVGELLEYMSAGRVRATPHRVVCELGEPRLSAPVFINPDLSSRVLPLCEPHAGHHSDASRPGEHVHRVLEPGSRGAPFCFGAAEWARKGLGQWCHQPSCTGNAYR